MNRGPGAVTAGACAEAPAAAGAPRDAAACEGSDTNPMNSGAGGGTAGARAEAPAAAIAPKGGAACEGSDTNSMNRGAGGGTAGARAEAPAAAVAPKDGAACEGSDTNSMNSGAGGGTAGAAGEDPDSHSTEVAGIAGDRRQIRPAGACGGGRRYPRIKGPGHGFSAPPRRPFTSSRRNKSDLICEATPKVLGCRAPVVLVVRPATFGLAGCRIPMRHRLLAGRGGNPR
jgi:hypothetical protein